jgi:hypothetical protein
MKNKKYHTVCTGQNLIEKKKIPHRQNRTKTNKKKKKTIQWSIEKRQTTINKKRTNNKRQKKDKQQ